MVTFYKIENGKPGAPVLYLDTLKVSTIEQTAENTTVKTVPATRIRDMYKKYIIPFIISGVLVLIYMAIRYFKKGIWKVLARTICMPILGELFLLAIIAITRIPVGRFIPVLVIEMYIASIMGVVKENEK